MRKEEEKEITKRNKEKNKKESINGWRRRERSGKEKGDKEKKESKEIEFEKRGRSGREKKS